MTLTPFKTPSSKATMPDMAVDPKIDTATRPFLGIPEEQSRPSVSKLF